MKAFILAAGNGERLRPLTDGTPKCLLPIGGVPLLGIWLDLCRRHCIRQILVNTHRHTETVRRYLRANASEFDVVLTEERTLLGSAGTLLSNSGWVARERDFWVLYGDILTNADLTRMLEFHRSRDTLATIGVSPVSNPTECGIVGVDHRHVVGSFVEKPAQPASNLAFTGLLVATPAILEFLPSFIPADVGFDVLPKLVGKMAAYSVSDYLVDIGTPARYEHAERTWPGLSLTARN